MIQNHSDISSQGSHPLNGEVVKYNDSELYRLIQNSTGITNTVEKKTDHIFHILGEDDTTTKTGTLKYLLLGITVLTGLGTLAAGACYYMIGRANSGAISWQEDRIAMSRLRFENHSISQESFDNYNATMSANTLTDIMSSQPVTQTPSSPYPYYERVYGSTASLNNNQPAIPVTTTEKLATTTERATTTTEKPVTTTERATTTTEKPVTTTERATTTTEKPVTTTERTITTTEKLVTTTERLTTTKKPVTTTDNPTSVYMKARLTTASSPGRGETAVTDYKHDRNRSVFYNTVNGTYKYPLGMKFFNELQTFCLKETRYNIEQAYRGNQELRCNLLDDINNKIAALKEDETLIRRINIEKDALSAEEHREEIMLRRQLATLYLAAEAIINKKDFNVFLHEVNRDYRRHPTIELMQREEKIMGYFPEEC